MLEAEQDAAARLKKSQAEMQKQVQSLEMSLRETQEKCSKLENGKVEQEKQVMKLRADLETERRDRILGTDIIADLQGESFSLMASVFSIRRAEERRGEEGARRNTAQSLW